MAGKNETFEGAVSYAVAGCGVTAISLADLSEMAQQVGVIVGLFIISLRAAYDTIRFIRYIRKIGERAP